MNLCVLRIFGSRATDPLEIRRKQCPFIHSNEVHCKISQEEIENKPLPKTVCNDLKKTGSITRDIYDVLAEKKQE